MAQSDDPPTPAKKKGGCAGCLGILVIAAAIGFSADACSPKDAKTPTPAPASSVQAAEPQATAPAQPGQAAPPPASPSHNADFYTAQKITAWYSGAQDKINALGGDASAIGTDAAGGDPTPVGADCRALKGHVADAQAYGPVPDTAAQQHWASALKSYGQAATSCISGTSTMDGSQMIQASDELAQGSGELAQVSARLREINAAAR